ncbi:hypothetical protein [Nonomuraea dietziae]|uniref:hypothetical protein n=1 Tax=Nonomuraea dietziae TaxID=65515 RepID=UPI0031D554E8
MRSKAAAGQSRPSEYAAAGRLPPARGFERDGPGRAEARGAGSAVLAWATAAYLPLAPAALARLADGEEEAERESCGRRSRSGDPELRLHGGSRSWPSCC